MALRQAGILVAGWGLSVSGVEQLDAWRGLVLDALRERYRSNAGTAEKMVADAGRLFRYLDARGVSSWSELSSDLVSDWYWAARPDRWGRLRRPAQTTAANRQWAALAVFQGAAGLGAPVDAEALVGERIKRRDERVSARPLSDQEAQLVQTFADGGMVASRRSLLVAFSFAGGTASEIAAVRVGDVDLRAATVTFKGRAARTNPLGEWPARALSWFMRSNPPLDEDALLCVTGRTSEYQAVHSVTVRLGEVLVDAGVAGRAGVTARSIRLTTAKQVLDEAGIEAAARFLGMTSLDTVADALAHTWRAGDGR